MMYYGVVEDRLDPKKMGRVRVRIAGIHSPNLQEIPTASLPWATVMTPTTSPSASGVGQTPFLVEGSWVVVLFNDEMLQDPVVIGSIPGYPSEKRSPNVGFSDPNNEYPRWQNESDLSRSARQNKFTSTKHFVGKTANRIEDIQVAHPPKVTTIVEDKADAYYADYPWSEVEASNEHRPAYPDNHVFESESGHIQEFDDTEGNVRYHRYHPAGSYEEIYDDGTRSLKIVGKDYEMVLEGKNMFVKGNLNVTVTGDMRTLVQGNYHLEIEKDMTVNVKGSIQQKVNNNWECEIGKDRSFNIGNNDNLTVMNDSVSTIMNNKFTTVEADYENTITGNYDVTTFSKLTMFSALGTSETTLGPLNVTASGNITTETPSNVNETFGGNQTTTITGNLDVDAARIDLN